MRISDWSSDVCSSDLPEPPSRRGAGQRSSRGSSRLMRFSTTSLSLAALTLVAVTMAAVGLLAGAAAGQSSDDAQTSDDAQSDDTGEVDWEKQPYIDRKSVGEGQSVSVSVDLGGRRRIKKKKTNKQSK